MPSSGIEPRPESKFDQGVLVTHENRNREASPSLFPYEALILYFNFRINMINFILCLKQNQNLK